MPEEQYQLVKFAAHGSQHLVDVNGEYSETLCEIKFDEVDVRWDSFPNKLPDCRHCVAKYNERYHSLKE